MAAAATGPSNTSLGVDDFEVAVGHTYWAAVAHWPRARITLRQGARVVMKSWKGE